MENLNAEQIKNAVACRTGNIIGCMNDECAYFRKGCGRPLFEDILLLIEFYEEKIFALENRLKECENGYEGTLAIERANIKELTEENERLRAENAEQDEAIIRALKHTGEIRRETRAEAIKELAERIKGYYNNLFGTTYAGLVAYHVGIVADEMLKEVEDNGKED